MFAMAAVQATKKALRKEIQNRLRALTKEQIEEQSKRVQEKLFELAAFKNSSRISIYLSTDGEIATVGILRRIFEEGKLCFVPRYHGEVMEMVRLNSMEDYEKLPMTKWNIKQPDLKEDRENALATGGLDLVIAPGVAFTKNGGRLGHGKGYYDSYFKKLDGVHERPVFKVGLALKEQMVDDVPMSEHDVMLDLVLYPE